MVQNQYVKREEGVKEKVNPSAFNSNKYLTKKFIQPYKYTNGLTGSYNLPTHTMFDPNKHDRFLPILALLILELYGLFGLTNSVTQFSVSITHNSKMVGPIVKRLFGK